MCVSKHWRSLHVHNRCVAKEFFRQVNRHIHFVIQLIHSNRIIDALEYIGYLWN